MDFFYKKKKKKKNNEAFSLLPAQTLHNPLFAELNPWIKFANDHLGHLKFRQAQWLPMKHLAIKVMGWS